MPVSADPQNDTVILPDAPAVPGLLFRRFRGEGDYPALLAVLQGSRAADHIEEVDSLDALAASYTHLVNCDPHRDMLFAEVDGAVVGYTRVHWQEASGVGLVYIHEGYLLPAWRGKGIGSAMVHHNERRLTAIAAGHVDDRPRFFRVTAAGTATAAIRLLEREGYRPIRYFWDMVRPDLENIPDCPLPEGLVVRPARPEHYRAIWQANEEAMSDHWGHIPYTEEDYAYWLDGDADFQPELWKVAWDEATDQIAGMVLGYILEDHNTKFDRKRGWTEDICVRRPWRRRGLARALIAESLRELKSRGMTEAALSVDTENPSGALRLYESMGFRAVKHVALYQKPLPQR